MNKIIFCRLLVGFLCLGLSGCLFEWRPIPKPPVSDAPAYVVDAATFNLYGEVCHQEPYWEEPLWCDWYSDDNAMCCVWLVDGWYEEWCQWDTGWCWNYNGSW